MGMAAILLNGREPFQQNVKSFPQKALYELCEI